MAKWTEKSKLVDALLELIDSGVNSHSLLSTNSSLEILSQRVNHTNVKSILNATLSYMRSSKLIYGKQSYTITQKARKRILQRQINGFDQKSQTNWDGRWRIVMFEIPEPMKTQRDALTSKLKHLGFVHLQRSVLIHPFDLLDQVVKIAQYYKVSSFIISLSTDNLSISNAKLVELIKKFDLKLDRVD